MAHIRQSSPDSGLGFQADRLGDSRLTRRGTTHSRDISGRGAAKAENAQGTPTQSNIPPSVLVYEENILNHIWIIPSSLGSG